MKIAALAGGVGGAKMAQGLSEILNPDDLSIIVNTGDDFKFLGLYMCPDLDTVSYTLAKMSNPGTGWGIKDDTFHTFEMMQKNGSPTWFKLGDKDLATHLERTRLLNQGKSLTEVTLHFKEIWHIKHDILPMSNKPVPTFIDTEEEGVISFQEYFVKHHFQPVMKEIIFKDIEFAKPSQEVLSALKKADVVVICPSNPFVSIDPILRLRGVTEILNEKYVVAVSPIIGGKAVKGPLQKMFIEQGIKPSPVEVARHYSGFLDCIFIDNQDEDYGEDIQQSGIIFQSTDILIPDLSNRIRLADEILKYINKNT